MCIYMYMCRIEDTEAAQRICNQTNIIHHHFIISVNAILRLKGIKIVYVARYK